MSKVKKFPVRAKAAPPLDTLMSELREVHRIADEHGDIGAAAMLEVFIDGAEKRNWFHFEASRQADQTGH